MSDPVVRPRIDADLVKGETPGEALGPVMTDASNKVPLSQIPSSAITDVYTTNSQVLMLALPAEVGDVCKRTDLGYSFILQALPASTLGNWIKLTDDFEPLGAVADHADETTAVHGVGASSIDSVSARNSAISSHAGLPSAHHSRYTDGEADARVAVHGNLTNNPHATTYGQVGAAPTSHTHAPGDVTGTAIIEGDARLTDWRTPTSHAHGSITNDGKVGSTANLPVKTGTAGAIEAGAFGTGATDFCVGNDSRLSDTRVPTPHDHTTLTTPVTSVLYVDGGRGDTYVENGSITKPFKTIAAAEAVATVISTIRICRKSSHYIENLTITNAGEIIGDGDPVIQGTVIFTGNPKTINRMQVVGDITCANVVVTFEQCEVTGKITTSGTGQVKYGGGIIAPASGSAIVNGGAAIAVNNALINVTGNVPGVNQTAGVVTLNNCLIFGASATTEVVKSSGGQILISETVVQNLGGGLAVSIPNGATTTPNILSNVTTVGGVACGTAMTKVEGLTMATGALTGSNLFYRPGSMISNTPAGGIAATTVQAAINELDGDKAPTIHVHAATDVTTGTLDGDRLPAFSTTKKAGVPATGTPSGKYLKDDGTWATVSASDTDAIHKSSSSEISTLTEKTAPLDADLAIIESVADSNAKRKVQLSNFAGFNCRIFSTPEVTYSVPGGSANAAVAIDGTTRTYINFTRINGSPIVTVYAYGKIPCDFKSFPSSPVAIGVTQRRVGTITTSITMYKNGTVDSTINGVSLAPGTSFAEATFAPGSTYAPGDEYLVVMTATLGNGLEYHWANLRLTVNRRVG